MDTASFVLKREEIQQRMDAHRVQATEAARHRGFLAWAFKVGVGALRLGANGESLNWVGSALWAVALPALMGYVGRKRESFVQRLIHAIIPASRTR